MSKKEQADEKKGKGIIHAFDPDQNSIIIKKDGGTQQFTFDAIFAPDSTQEQVYEDAARPVLDSVLDGYNGTIFAYGQTGTGKTHTMVGEIWNTEMKGIIPWALEQIFEEQLELQAEFNYEVNVAFIQIYLEMIQDLLDPQNEEIRIREDPS